MPEYVVHKHKTPYDVYIGRPSKWGNPYSHKPSTRAQYRVASREEAIAKHREWLLSQPELIAQVRQELRGKVLGCWCAPLSCHGDVLAEVANRYPLYCVDLADHGHAGTQCLGPFNTHAEAVEYLDPKKPRATVRYCRRVLPSEIAFDYEFNPEEDDDGVDWLVDELDEAATSGDLLDAAWYCWEERVVSVKDGHVPTELPKTENFRAWADEHLVVDAYVCEGDE